MDAAIASPHLIHAKYIFNIYLFIYLFLVIEFSLAEGDKQNLAGKLSPRCGTDDSLSSFE